MPTRTGIDSDPDSDSDNDLTDRQPLPGGDALRSMPFRIPPSWSPSEKVAAFST
ncbi:MAG: hypothetical protein PHF14_06170 [Verrucomicrobiota bacterium]|nr:hypothetical protein [Verrucomicrobiota bacterium]